MPGSSQVCRCALDGSVKPHALDAAGPRSQDDAMRVLVLGAGFGGLELTTRLAEDLGDDADVVLIDQADSFVFGFSKLDVMFGRAGEAHVRHRYADLVRPGVLFVQSTIRSLDPERRRV